MNLEINPSWTFKETVAHLKTLREQYEGILSSFYYLELPRLVEFKRNVRNSFYALNIEEYEKDKIWNYMNHFEYYYVLKGMADRRKN